MNAWKSPLLLFGFAIILLAGGALFAPYFIDWGNYRADFEKYGRQLTGRETKVLGDINVKLFPWPRMTVKDVRVANPPGAMVKELFRADEIDVRLRLAPLLSGKLEVEGIEINRPVIGLERLASGQGSWFLQPEAGAVKIFGAEDIAVSGISITNGTIVLADGQRGGEAQLDGFNAFVTARSLNGPWKLRGEAVVNDQGIDISLNTGKWRSGQALKFGLRLSPLDGAGLTYSFDGQSSTGEKHEISGKLKIVPTANKQGKSDAQADFRPMVFRSDVKADFDGIRFSKIEVAPRNAVDVQTFLTGQATVKLGSILQVDANLKAARFDVDSVLGNRGRKTLRSINSLEAIADIVKNMPEKVHLRTVIDLKTLVLAGQTLDGASIDLEVAESTLKINRLKVALPGQTRATFKGGLLAGEQQPQLIGDLTLDMISLKDFVKWAADDYKREVDQKWSGARGRFKLAAKIDLSRQNFRLQDGAFSLDQASGTLNLNLTTGEQSAVSVSLVSDVLDIDRYAPEGLLSQASKDDLSGFLTESLTALVGERDLALTAKTGRLVINSVEARDVAIEFNANENSVEFRQFKLGSVGDASVDLSGLVKFSDDNVTGAVNGTINADNPAKLVRLISAVEPSKAWLKSISPLKLTINGQAVARENQTSGKLALSGVAGQTTVAGNGKFDGKVADWQKARLHLSGQLAGKSAKDLLAVFGLGVEQGRDGAGKVAITATGNLNDGLATSADFEVFGVTGQFSGRVESRDAGPKALGRLAVLIENTDQLFSVFGLSPRDGSPIGKVFSGEGVVEVSPQVFDLKEIRGTVAGTSFKGSLNLAFGNEQPVLKLAIESGRLSVPFVLGAALLRRDGKRQTAATRFSREAMVGVKADVTVKTRNLQFWPGFDAQEATLSLTADDGAIKLKAAGLRGSDQPVRLELDANVGEQLTRVSGKIAGALKLANLLQTDQSGPVLDGVTIINGEFGGSGRTPGGLLAALSGKGFYQITDGVVRNISPAQFAKELPQAETAKDVEEMIANSLRTGDMKFGSGKGEIELENGVARFVPLAINGVGAVGSLRVLYELPSGLADISLRLKLAEPANVPGFEVAYAGPPSALAASSNFADLKSYLSVAALNRTLDKLEALEEEQRRLVEEEKKARAEAEAQRAAQQEKQRLLRERQRQLLEEATRKKEESAEKERKEKQRKLEKPVAPVVITPIPRPPITVKIPEQIPVLIPAPATRVTVTPEVQVNELPPLNSGAVQES
ncbi:hypothetical protein MNBD_ALPHA08-294, partial [hydrothermal vent metagenome]